MRESAGLGAGVQITGVRLADGLAIAGGAVLIHAVHAELEFVDQARLGQPGVVDSAEAGLILGVRAPVVVHLVLGGESGEIVEEHFAVDHVALINVVVELGEPVIGVHVHGDDGHVAHAGSGLEQILRRGGDAATRIEAGHGEAEGITVRGRERLALAPHQPGA